MRYETREALEVEAGRHLATWQPILLLQEWEIRVEVGDEPTEALAKRSAAMTRRDSVQRLARMFFWWDFWARNNPCWTCCYNFRSCTRSFEH